MRVSVGLTRKVGQPNYGSLGASCAVEMDVDINGPDLEGDAPAFRRRVRAAYAACARAVGEELERRQAAPHDAPPDPPRRPATAPQVRALRRLAARRGLDLDAALVGRYGVDGPERLTVAEASRLIDRLRRTPAAAPA